MVNCALAPESPPYALRALEQPLQSVPLPVQPREPQSVLSPAQPPAPTQISVTAANLVWEAADRDTLLKGSSRTRFIEASGMKIIAFLADAELFLTLCNRQRDRWKYFVLAWLGSEEAEKVRR